MKKWLKIVIIIIGFLILCIVLDILCVFTINRPLFAFKESDKVYRGILYDTYNCEEYPMAQIKAKSDKFSCLIVSEEYILGKISDINNNYIIIDGVNDDNYLKTGQVAHISLRNNPKIIGSNNLIIGQYIKMYPLSINEVYPVIITTNEISIIDKKEIIK